MQSLLTSTCSLRGQHLGHHPRAQLRSSQPARLAPIRAEGAQLCMLASTGAAVGHSRSQSAVMVQMAVVAVAHPPRVWRPCGSSQSSTPKGAESIIGVGLGEGVVPLLVQHRSAPYITAAVHQEAAFGAALTRGAWLCRTDTFFCVDKSVTAVVIQVRVIVSGSPQAVQAASVQAARSQRTLLRRG